MSIEIVVGRTKKIESLLVSVGAEGRGLHEKLTSVEDKLEAQKIKRIRFIASIRNKSVHDYDFSLTENDYRNFIEACDDVDLYLSDIVEPRSTSSSSDSSKGLLDTFSDSSPIGKVGIVAAGIGIAALVLSALK
ncbi:MAG: hypothetical protein U9N57_14870 [Pseudomonadota bacterium]|nr:hypothetical protein [Pseudomonadota bacterium]